MTKCRTTHHHACACREARFERMERALKVIQIWAAVPSLKSLNDRQNLRDIEQMCKEALAETSE